MKLSTLLLAALVTAFAVAQVPDAPAQLIVVSGGSTGGGSGGGGGGGPVGHGYTVTHYVAPHASVSGSQSHDMDVSNSPAFTSCTSVGTPCTAGRAFANADSGDVVEFAPGVYLAPGTNDSESPTFKPQLSGTSGTPTIFTAKYPAAYNRSDSSLWSELGQTNDANKGTSPTAGAGGHAGVWVSHFAFDGFYFNGGSGGNAPITTRGIIRAYSPANTNQNHQYRRILMDVLHLASGDNWDGIQIQGPSGVKVLDSYFRGSSENGLSDNAAIITTYGAPNFEIAYNTFVNTQEGLFLKGTNAGQGNYGSYHHNLMTGGTYALITISETYAATGQTDVYQNLAYDWNSVVPLGCIDVNAEAGSANLQNFAIYNNTCVSELTSAVDQGLLVIENVNGTNGVIRDNIFAYRASQSQVIVNAVGAGSTQTTNMTVNYNRYWDNGDTTVYAFNGNGSLSFAQYKTNTGWDANSTEGDPDFENAAADDYRLDGDSPLLTLSSTGGPIGAYITGSEVFGPRVSPTY